MGDLNTSFARLQSFNLEGLEDVEGCMENWMTEVKKKLKCEEEDNLTAKMFEVPLKAVSSVWLADARDIMCRQRDMLDNMKEMIELLKTEALGDKSAVIRLQGELLECKDKQLKSLQAAVETTVQTTVQKEIRSYSAVVAKKSSAPAFTPESLKKVVKTAMEEDDRSKNLMVFGLVEEEGEQIKERISGLLLELGEKPRVAASRLGTKSPGASRPVKVTLGSSTSIHQILTKARELKQVERLKSVYICPDRSPDQRAARRRLVTDLKKAAETQPDRHHFIRGGRVCSEAKSVT